MKKSKVYILVVLIAFFIGACVAPAEKQQPCENQKHSKELRILLHKLDTVTFEPAYSELERDQYRLSYATQISDIVAAMVKRQQDDKVLGCGLDLSARQQELFNQLSSKLQQQARQLVDFIKLQQTEYIKPQIKRINQTCTSCHQQLKIEFK